MISHKKSFLSPLLLSLLYIFLYLPLLVVVIYSFNKTPIHTPLNSPSLHWYKELFSNGEIWVAFFNSMIVSLSSTALSILLSLLLIYYKTVGGKIQKCIPLFYGNIMIPDTLLGIALLSFFSMMNISLGLTTIIISHTVLGLGLTIPLISMRFKDLSPSLLEASAVLGASSWTTFKKIVIPFMMPALFATSLIVFILSFDDFVLANFFAGPSAQTLSLFLVGSLRFGISPVINALTTFILLFTTLIIAFLFLFKKKEKLQT